MGRQYTLTNGKTVTEPRSKTLFITSLILAIIILFVLFLRLNFNSIKLDQVNKILAVMFSPYRSLFVTETYRDYFRYAFSAPVINAMLETLRISFGGSLIGAITALPLSILSARNIVKVPWIYQTARAIMNLIRTIPILVIAIVVTFFFGYGVLPGVVAIAIFTFGIMSKMMYEIIETIDMGPVEALDATGANKTKAFFYGAFPQVFPIYLGYFIYCFEINVRSSIILGFIGSGGIGIIMSAAIESYRYDRAGGITIVLFLVVMMIQLFTSYLRGKLQ